jgi:prolipoprotein diacylglyceryltransferase
MKTFIPTPSSSTLELGFFTIHYYALCILLGIVVAIWITKKRYQALGGDSNDVSDLAIYAIPSGNHWWADLSRIDFTSEIFR